MSRLTSRREATAGDRDSDDTARDSDDVGGLVVRLMDGDRREAEQEVLDDYPPSKDVVVALLKHCRTNAITSSTEMIRSQFGQ